MVATLVELSVCYYVVAVVLEAIVPCNYPLNILATNVPLFGFAYREVVT
uniref:Uncharacterized protein n=1 Tax=Podoviridae sp. ct8Lf7 TaxID=2827723 RepID=A0A8S5S076_9CAUD|nr:MAG TPA: hypothetical protein [Podoviridae sp. ct8Lf7]